MAGSVLEAIDPDSRSMGRALVAGLPRRGTVRKGSELAQGLLIMQGANPARKPP